MIDMPKVSVIIPVYNVSKYIEKCARSLFEQTLDDMEYLFIDDCTLDDSIDILNRVLIDYPNRKNQVRIIRMPQNSGQAAVRKKGILTATGEYLIHCDSDDWVDSNAYKQLYDHMIRTRAEMCFFNNYRCVKGKIVKLYRSFTLDKTKLIKHMLCGNHDFNQLWGVLVKRTIYADNTIFPENNQGEDFALVIQYLCKANKITYIKKHYYYYRQLSTSITKRKDDESVRKRVIDQYKNYSIAIESIERTFVEGSLNHALNICRKGINDKLKRSGYDKINNLEPSVVSKISGEFIYSKYWQFRLFIRRYYIYIVRSLSKESY